MTRSALATLAAVTGVLALACSEQRPHSPEAPMQAVTSAAPSLACDFNELRRAVARYFAPGDQQTAFDLLKAMQAAGANTTAANAPGFSLLRLVEAVNDGGRAQGTLADGSDVSNRTLACMSVASPALPISFVVALGPTGLDGVRGGDPATDQAPVFSHDCQFGIQPPAAGWTAAMDGPHLFYGGAYGPIPPGAAGGGAVRHIRHPRRHGVWRWTRRRHSDLSRGRRTGADRAVPRFRKHPAARESGLPVHLAAVSRLRAWPRSATRADGSSGSRRTRPLCSVSPVCRYSHVSRWRRRDAGRVQPVRRRRCRCRAPGLPDSTAGCEGGPTHFLPARSASQSSGRRRDAAARGERHHHRAGEQG